MLASVSAACNTCSAPIDRDEGFILGIRASVQLIGLPTDHHSSYLPGAADGPDAIRRALRSDHSNMATECGLELGVDIALNDRGDVALDGRVNDVERIRRAVEAASGAGHVPICLGGDHMVTYPAVAGVAAVHGPVNILHFDAHPDLYEDFGGDPFSHASPFARIMENGLATRLVQVGIRTLNSHCREQAHRYQVEIVEMRDFLPDEVPIPDAPLYISIDLDGLDPACAPGVSHHEPGGMTTREVLRVLGRIRTPIVGADVVELNPSRDINGMTATLAAKLVKELAALAAQGSR